MKFRLDKITQLCGRMANIYAVVPDGGTTSTFEEFLENYKAEYTDEIQNILTRLRSIGDRVGARLQYFKEHEGQPGDMVCALYDEPEKQLRLYCIRMGHLVVILGGGGPKQTRTWQKDVNLTHHVSVMMEVSRRLAERIRSREVTWINDGTDLDGNFEFNDEYE